jgi:antitoxin component of RelBE/YafQ-DinJ toxin-antitoxin module
MNASVAVNMFVHSVLRTRSIPFEITDIADEATDEKILAETLRATLLERIKEGEETDRWIDHATVMKDARQIIASAQATR